MISARCCLLSPLTHSHTLTWHQCRLSRNGECCSNSLLEKVSLEIRCEDRSGTPANKIVNGLVLSDDEETIEPFTVPPALASIQVVMTAEVQPVSSHSQDSVSLSGIKEYAVSVLAAEQEVAMLHLRQDDQGHQQHCTASHTHHLKCLGYRLLALGHAGEPVAAQTLTLNLTHKMLRRPMDIVVQTDANGAISLGALSGVTSVSCTSAQRNQHRWELDTISLLAPSRLICAHIPPGQTSVDVPVPYPFAVSPAEAADRSLFGLVQGYNAISGFSTEADFMASIGSLEEGGLKLVALKEGEYKLKLRQMKAEVIVRVAAGPIGNGYGFGRRRLLPVSQLRSLAPDTPAQMPPQISEITVDAQDVTVQVNNAGPGTRCTQYRHLKQFLCGDELLSGCMYSAQPLSQAPTKT